MAGKYGLFEANTTLIRPTPRRKGRIRPFYVNTAHSISSACFDETCVDTPEKRIAFNHLHNKVNALENVHENIDEGKDITKITMGTSDYDG